MSLYNILDNYVRKKYNSYKLENIKLENIKMIKKLNRVSGTLTQDVIESEYDNVLMTKDVVIIEEIINIVNKNLITDFTIYFYENYGCNFCKIKEIIINFCKNNIHTFRNFLINNQQSVKQSNDFFVINNCVKYKSIIKFLYKAISDFLFIYLSVYIRDNMLMTILPFTYKILYNYLSISYSICSDTQSFISLKYYSLNDIPFNNKLNINKLIYKNDNICKFILTKGKNKGKMCGAHIRNSDHTMCSKHR